MGAGIPGTGMATLFYIISAVAMPLIEIVHTVRGRSSWARWGLIARHLVVALLMTAAAYGTLRLLPSAVLPPDATLGGLSPLLVTIALFASYLVIVNLAAVLVRGQVTLPLPKEFPERRASLRMEAPDRYVDEDRRLSA
jgi:hypothetical protein